MCWLYPCISGMLRILPGTELWLGGPEVSFCSGDILEELPFLSGIMRGEGEETFACLCRFWEERESKGDFRGLEAVPGITWRDGEGMVRSNPDREPLDLDELPFPYQGTEDLRNRIIYYESSRGCPFSCSYCLSSVEKKMRFRSLERVFEELQFFLDRKVPQVKFVDRTFNCRRRHTLAVWEFLLEHDNGITNFHFEIGADLLDALPTLKNVRSAGRLRLTDRLPGAWVSSAGQMSMRGAPNWVTGWLRNTGKRGL